MERIKSILLFTKCTGGNIKLLQEHFTPDMKSKEPNRAEQCLQLIFPFDQLFSCITVMIQSGNLSSDKQTNSSIERQFPRRDSSFNISECAFINAALISLSSKSIWRHFLHFAEEYITIIILNRMLSLFSLIIRLIR